MRCIEWTGAVSACGYGVTWHNGKMELAHRVAAGLPEGKVVRHTCDNPLCVNPDHLLVGTHKENTQDIFDRGRWGRPNHKVPVEAYQEWAELRAAGRTLQEIADQYGVTKQRVWKKLKHG